jgi:MFS superfamily sulfate permease-like transporter
MALASHTLLPKALLIRLARVPFMDITALNTLEEIVTPLRKKNVHVLLCEANPRVIGKQHNAVHRRSARRGGASAHARFRAAADQGKSRPWVHVFDSVHCYL